jgi:hypothetical protein
METRNEFIAAGGNDEIDGEDGKTGRREDGKTGSPKDRKTGRREDRKTGRPEERKFIRQNFWLAAFRTSGLPDFRTFLYYLYRW